MWQAEVLVLQHQMSFEGGELLLERFGRVNFGCGDSLGQAGLYAIDDLEACVRLRRKDERKILQLLLCLGEGALARGQNGCNRGADDETDEDDARQHPPFARMRAIHARQSCFCHSLNIQIRQRQIILRTRGW